MPSMPRLPAACLPYLSYAAGLAAPAPRMVRFVISEARRARDAGRDGDLPPVRLTPGVIAQAALDEWTVAVMKTPGRVPTTAALEATLEEVRDAHEVYRDRGWLDDPASFHAAPPPLEPIAITRSRVPGIRYEHLTFESGYAPHPDDPARARWDAIEQNKVAHAWVLRHAEPDRPWVVCLHPFGMGYPQLDLRAFRARWLHLERGLNVVMPIAPFHGPRRTGRLSGTDFMTYKLLDIVHGFGHAVWDVRRVIGWIRAQGGERIVLHGASMGAHVTGMLAGLERGLDGAIAMFPTTNLIDLFVEHGPASVRRPDADVIGAEARSVHRIATPLSFPPLIAPDRLFIAAGLADRMATPAQAVALWEHWGKPRIEWFNSNHVTFLWSGRVTGFVREALHRVGYA